MIAIISGLSGLARSVIAAGMLLLLSACFGSNGDLPPLPEAAATGAYLLGPGDKLRIGVFEQPDISGEFTIGQEGQLAMPFIEPVPATRIGVQELTSRIAAKLTESGYLKPRVTAEIATYRNFYIFGEIARPGGYPYVSNLTMLGALALGGGYTYRADRESFLVTRLVDGKSGQYLAQPTDHVLPDDIIQAPERHF